MTTPFKLPNDKWLHILIGLMIFSTSLIFFDHRVSVWITIIIGFLKEVNDHTKTFKKLLTSKGKTTFSIYDFFATITIPLIIASIINMQ